MQKHTPVPWEIATVAPKSAPTAFFIKRGIVSIAQMNGPCDLYMNAREDAEFIIRACNVHHELLDFIKDIRPFLGYDPEATLHKRADALIAKAEAKQISQGG